MTDTNAVRLNLRRRAHSIIKSRSMPPLSNRRMHAMTHALAQTVGDDGITDADLWTVIRLTLRGMFD